MIDILEAARGRAGALRVRELVSDYVLVHVTPPQAGQMK